MKALSIAREPNILEWMFSAAIVLVGLALMSCQFLPGTTPENELTYVKGVPTAATQTKITSLRRGQQSVVEWTIAPYQFNWASGDPHYDEVVSVLASGRPLEVWFSTKRESAVLKLNSALVRLYKMRADGRQIISYSEAAEVSENNALLIIGGVIAALGAFALLINWQQLQNMKGKSRR